MKHARRWTYSVLLYFSFAHSLTKNKQKNMPMMELLTAPAIFHLCGIFYPRPKFDKRIYTFSDFPKIYFKFLHFSCRTQLKLGCNEIRYELGL